MPNLATWIREKDDKWFRPIFAKHPEIKVWNALSDETSIENMNGLLLTGGADIAPEFLRQEVADPSVLEKDIDPKRDRWEFAATENALAHGLPILGICKGMQVFNVALGGTLKLDIPGHRLPEQKDHNIQPLRYDRNASNRLPNVNSSHHQAIDRPGEGLEVEAWCATDGVIEQLRMRNHPFAVGVQYHPERDAKYYETLFEDFFARFAKR
ncbi:MAG: gamma-glutamyl-gamma-aminobutyrate hydrolase family protein [Verrucomicrobiota bacterium]